MNQQHGLGLALGALDCGEASIVLPDDQVFDCVLTGTDDLLYDASITMTDLDTSSFTVDVATEPRP